MEQKLCTSQFEQKFYRGNKECTQTIKVIPENLVAVRKFLRDSPLLTGHSRSGMLAPLIRQPSRKS